jgi:hypothetical protein
MTQITIFWGARRGNSQPGRAAAAANRPKPRRRRTHGPLLHRRLLSIRIDMDDTPIVPEDLALIGHKGFLAGLVL